MSARPSRSTQAVLQRHLIATRLVKTLGCSMIVGIENALRNATPGVRFAGQNAEQADRLSVLQAICGKTIGKSHSHVAECCVPNNASFV